MSNGKNLTNAIAKVKKYLEKMPQKPGIYQMIDKDKKVIYVGKAKNLKKRVTNYSKLERQNYRIQSMISLIDSIEIIVTKTEEEALLLEANLIKKYSPKYNILLKDGKSFPYILIAKDHDFAKIIYHRGKRDIEGDYYGPFPSAYKVRQSIQDLQKAFLLRPCTDSYFKNRDRPCMEYQIKRCSAPCVDKISKKDYEDLVKQANDFLSGTSRDIQDKLAILMQKASDNFEYEKAAIYRDRIKALNHIQKQQAINIANLKDSDVIGIFKLGSNCIVKIFFYRNGSNLGSQNYFFSDVEHVDLDEILGNFIIQFYNNNFLPKEILVSHLPKDQQILENIFKISIKIPKRGYKKEIIDLVINNAKEALQQKLDNKENKKQIFAKLCQYFNLTDAPNRIEIYDNSHISGKYAIGAMVVADKKGFNKSEYRRFKIENINKEDDYEMMRQVFRRRFSNKEGKRDLKDLKIPDLILIDGGRGHLNTVKEIFDELKLQNIKFVAISKGVDRNAGKEKFHIFERDEFSLPMTDSALYYLQTLRDEAHRFAISSHRNLRSKSVYKSILDEVPNIGTKRKKLLITHFGSADAVKNASISELEAVNGINKSIASQIYNYFQK